MKNTTRIFYLAIALYTLVMLILTRNNTPMVLEHSMEVFEEQVNDGINGLLSDRASDGVYGYGAKNATADIFHNFDISTPKNLSSKLAIWKHAMQHVSIINKNISQDLPYFARKYLQYEREIVYEDFVIKEPFFIDKSYKDIFHKDERNRNDLGKPPAERLKGVVRVMPNGIVSSTYDCGWRTNLAEYEAKNIAGVKKVASVLVPLLVPDAFAFQLFLNGVVPKLMQAYDVISLPEVKILMYKPRDSDKVVYEMLDRLNISRDKLVFHSGKAVVTADVVINTCITPPLHPLLWQMFRRMFGVPEHMPIPVNDGYVILLTRAGSHNSGRKILNNNDVVDLLSRRYGDRLLIFKGGYSLSEAINIFSKSKIIIGVHGGAFFNINFAPKETNIVEIVPVTNKGISIPRIAHTIIWQMSSLIGQPYWRFMEEEVSQGNVHVQLDKLKAALDRIDLNQRMSRT